MRRLFFWGWVSLSVGALSLAEAHEAPRDFPANPIPSWIWEGLSGYEIPPSLLPTESRGLRLEELAARLAEAAEKKRFERLYWEGYFRRILVEELERLRKEAWAEASRDPESKRERKPREVFQPLRARIRTAGQPAAGPESAPIEVVTFTDFTCGLSVDLEREIKEFLRAWPNEVRWVARHYALSPRGGEAFRLVEAALCAQSLGKYWEFREALWSVFGRALSVEEKVVGIAADLGLEVAAMEECLASGRMASRVIEEQEEAMKIGVLGSPYVFLNGRFARAENTLARLNELLREELKKP